MPKGIPRKSNPKLYAAKGEVKASKPIQVVNLSGEKIDEEAWKKGDKALAIRMADWLTQRVGNDVAISTTHDGAILLDYGFKGSLQPTVKIYAGRVIFPKGTNIDIMMAFLSST